MGNLTICMFIAAAVAFSVALDCSRIITKEQQGVLSWLGMIDITVPIATDIKGWTMTLRFDQNFTGVGVWQGFVEYNGTEKWAAIRNRDDSDAILKPGDQKSMRFRINYGLNIPIPQVVNLQFEDVEMCN